MESKSILLVAGEASGDLHGARVVKEILKAQPGIHVYGVGGTELQKAGMELLANSSDIAVTGFFEVFVKLRKILQIFKCLVVSIHEKQPSLVILIDCPDFNLRLAKKLYKTGIPVIYYISPHVWIWRQKRIHLIKKYISKMLVVFPFEKTFYKSWGVEVDFVGHPLLDFAKPSLESGAIFKKMGLDETKKTIVLMPGSRRNEIRYLLKPILEAAELIYQENPNVQFVLPLASTLNRQEVSSEFLSKKLPLKVVEEQVYDA